MSPSTRPSSHRTVAAEASGARGARSASMADTALVPSAGPSAKRPRVDHELVAADSRALAGLEAGTVPRTSSLDAPTMLLHGHGDAVCSVKISPNGNVLASCSNDKTVFLWNVRGDCQARAGGAPAARVPARVAGMRMRKTRWCSAGALTDGRARGRTT